jgi:hypothetical protein
MRITPGADDLAGNQHVLLDIQVKGPEATSLILTILKTKGTRSLN